jgi:hypothetical protein
VGDHEWRDPALSRLDQDRYDDPAHNPIAFLPVGPVPVWDPGALYVMPIVTPRDDEERSDGWCEDRSPELGEITENDGED